MKTMVAIDPGQSGGVAVRQFGRTFCHAMPGTPGDVVELFASLQSAAEVEGDEMLCVIEEVSGFAGKAQPGSAMFRFGEQYGFLQGVVMTLGIRLMRVRPQVWQKAFALGTASRCASKTEWKNKLKAEAQRRFPQIKVTLKTADALLILDYAMRGEFQPRMYEGGDGEQVGAAMPVSGPPSPRPSPQGEGETSDAVERVPTGGPEDYLGCGDGRGQ